MKIFKLTDIIKVKVGEVTLHISPFKFEQKQEILSLIQAFTQTQDAINLINASKLAIKYGLKKVEGIENCDGTNYKLETDENGITEECIEDILNCELQDGICSACIAFVNGVPVQINDLQGNKLEGVDVILPKTKKKAPKNKK